MKYILSEETFYNAVVGASHVPLENYLIIHILDEENQVESFEVFEVADEKIEEMTKSKSTIAFRENYITNEFNDKQIIKSVEIIIENQSIHHISEKILGMVFKVDEEPYVSEIDITDNEEIKAIIQGYMEVSAIQIENLIAIVNNDGIREKLPFNRGFYGNFLIVGLENSQFVSVTEEQIKKVYKKFEQKKNKVCKSKYIQNYFKTNDLSVKKMNFNIDGENILIEIQPIIDFIMYQENMSVLNVIELELKNIEKNRLNIYDYLRIIGNQLLERSELI